MPNPIFHPAVRRTPSRKEPLTVHLRQPPDNALIERHSHGYGQLAFPVLGGMRFTAQDMLWIVPMFRAIWLPPGFEHESVMLGKVEFYVVYVDSLIAPLPLSHCGVIEVSPLMREVIFELADKPSDTRRHFLLTQLLLEEIGVARPLSLGLPLPRDRRLKALCELLMREPASDRTLKQWAPMAGASERTLARLFRDELGTSFAAWRQQLRLARAVDLMSRGNNLADVAAEIGYSAPAAFSTMFKRALGMPPSRFANSC